jgi:hypothetical protein
VGTPAGGGRAGTSAGGRQADIPAGATLQEGMLALWEREDTEEAPSAIGEAGNMYQQKRPLFNGAVTVMAAGQSQRPTGTFFYLAVPLPRELPAPGVYSALNTYLRCSSKVAFTLTQVN